MLCINITEAGSLLYPVALIQAVGGMKMMRLGCQEQVGGCKRSGY